MNNMNTMGMGMNPQMMMMNNMMNQMNMGMNNMNQQAQQMANNNANMSNNNSTNNSSSQNSGKGISVIFRISGANQNAQNGAPIMVQCMPDEKVSEVIKKYQTKANDNDPSKKFIFNAKNLVPSLTVAEAGITNNANIFVVTTKGIKGAN